MIKKIVKYLDESISISRVWVYGNPFDYIEDDIGYKFAAIDREGYLSLYVGRPKAIHTGKWLTFTDSKCIAKVELDDDIEWFDAIVQIVVEEHPAKNDRLKLNKINGGIPVGELMLFTASFGV